MSRHQRSLSDHQLAAILLRLRKHIDLTPSEMAEASGVCSKSVVYFENGTKKPTLRYLVSAVGLSHCDSVSDVISAEELAEQKGITELLLLAVRDRGLWADEIVAAAKAIEAIGGFKQ